MSWRQISVIAISLIVFLFYMASFQIFGNNYSDFIQGKLVSLLATLGGLAVVHIILISIIKENQLKKGYRKFVANARGDHYTTTDVLYIVLQE